MMSDKLNSKKVKMSLQMTLSLRKTIITNI